MAFLQSIYRFLFGKDYESVWRQFASETKGTYSYELNHKVQLKVEDFPVSIEAHIEYITSGSSTYEFEFSRGIAEYVSSENFYLLVTKQGLIENVNKLFGAQDIKTGDGQFDKKFMIKSNDENKTRNFLSNDFFRQMLMENKILRLEITDKDGLFGEKPKIGNTMIYYAIDEKIRQVVQLHTMRAVLYAALKALQKLNLIKSEDVATQPANQKTPT